MGRGPDGVTVVAAGRLHQTTPDSTRTAYDSASASSPVNAWLRLGAHAHNFAVRPGTGTGRRSTPRRLAGKPPEASASCNGLHPSVVERLARLAPDQRAAATAPPGPSLCIAPAGSGKTTTLVARAAWLIAGGTPPEAIRAITFNKRAAVEMTERLDAAVAPLGVAPGAVRVRTFHALGREILRDAGVAVEPMADRAAVLAEVAPWADEADAAPPRHR